MSCLQSRSLCINYQSTPYSYRCMIIKVEGLNEAIARFSSLEISSALNAGIKKSVYKIQSAAIRETPTDTWVLKNSWRVRFDNLSGQLVNTSKYAPFVHFGTKPHIIRIKNKKALSNWKTLFGKVVNHPWTKANPFLKRALDQEKWKIPQIISHEMYMLLNK